MAETTYSYIDHLTTPNGTTYEIHDVGRGQANGVAQLDANGKVLSTQLPSYVDDVIEYASSASFPSPGESGKIYVAQDTNKTYRWGGTAYVVISETLSLGETSATAYRGDRGKIAYDHSQSAHAPSNAQPNQNAFSNVAIGSTTIAADSTTDTLTLEAGANIALTPDTTNDKITIKATDTKYTASTISIGSASGWSAGTLPSLASTTASITGISSVGSVPSLTTESISCDDITDWNQGTLPTTESASVITSVSLSKGSLPTLGTAITAVNAVGLSTASSSSTANPVKYLEGVSISGGATPTTSAVTVLKSASLSGGAVPSITVDGTTMVFNAGSFPTLSTSTTTVNSVTNVGSTPSLSPTTKYLGATSSTTNIPNVTGVGSLPSIATTTTSINNITNVGTLPTLSYTSRTVKSVKSWSAGSTPTAGSATTVIKSIDFTQGTLPALTITSKNVATGITAQ